MLQPLRNNSGRTASHSVRYLSPPYGGWNARDDYEAMKSSDAIVLQNMIASDQGVVTRKGHAEHATGLGANVEALMEYAPQSGVTKLFGATATDIYDVSAAEAVGAADISGLSNGQWNHTMFATPGGTFLACVNGADGLRTYDGTAWAEQTVTGADADTFATVTAHQSRLWFVEQDSMKVHYLPTQSIAGAASTVDFGPFSKLGGYMVGMASWTRDGGAGMDDLAVFVTSRGQVHVYSGSDPTVSGGFIKVGTFKIAEPVGRRCFVDAGADLGILTSQGLLPLSAILPLSNSGAARKAATANISAAFDSAYNGGKGLQGWQVTEYPRERLVVVNVPLIEGVSHEQFVMFAGDRGQPWSRFRGLNASCWSVFAGNLYFGSPNGTIYRYTGTEDDGAEIPWFLVQAFTDLGTVDEKTFHRMLPQFYGPPGYGPRLGLRFNFDNADISFPADAYNAPGAIWDEAIWDDAEWATSNATNNEWHTVVGKAYKVAILVSGATTEKVVWNGAKLSYVRGNGI